MAQAESKQAHKPLTNLDLEMPKMVQVVLLNDNYTDCGFVVAILQSIFGKSLQQAQSITTEIHNNGKGIAGIYPYDIGETKAQETIQAAQKAQFPLKVFTESL